MAVYVLRTFKSSGDTLTPRAFSLGVKAIHSSGLNVLLQESKKLNLSDSAVTNDVEEDIGRSIEHDNILEKVNKSRLQPKDQNIVHGKPPYVEPIIPYHRTHEYHRRMFGRYGLKSGVNLSVFWPTKEELKNSIEYENIAYPDSIQVMTARAKLKATEALEAIKKREDEISSKMAKLEQWKSEIEQRAQKKLMEAQVAKEKKERLVEEVRRHFGFKVDPRDDRFKEMLQQKEKEESKREKAERKKAKQAKMMAKLVAPLTVVPPNESK